ncbi:DUF2721 domain-containing protein [Sphingomicrobium sp. XHP0235]|uniref:DUF2721 domain-containing protein n=1 Tax=Sphingomicrobium aquimarinum TaxID=3133971 RepID=UPI0031FE765D
MIDSTDLNQLGHTIELAIAPVFLLVAAGGFLNVLSGRLSRVVDRARTRATDLLGARGEEHDRIRAELRVVDRRITLVNAAIGLVVLAAVLVCCVVILIFIGKTSGFILNHVITWLFGLAMLLIAASFTAFLIETRIASRWLRVSADLLDHQEERD